MILLPNGCHCSGKPADPEKETLNELSVYPSNWKTVKASMKKDWYIQYRFYDPLFKERYPKGKFIMVKGMNIAKTIHERRVLTNNLMRNELNDLIVEGFNPITGQSIAPFILEHDIDPSLPWLIAITIAYKQLKGGPKVISDMKYVCSNMSQAAKQLRLDQLSIKDIKPKHIKLCLTHLQKTKPLENIGKSKKKKTWGAPSYNRHLSYLTKIFKQLVMLEAIEQNPVTDIERQIENPSPREILSNEEAIRVDKYLKENYYTFWRYMQVFHDSGGRSTELMRLQAKDVNLKSQVMTLTTIKGKVTRRVEHTITNISLPLWQELMALAKDDDYVFSEGLKPGSKPIDASQINKRWLKHVKGTLGISKDFYAGKHKYLDKITELLGLEDAAGAAGHTTTAMVKKHYAVKEKERTDKARHERLKIANVPFIINQNHL